LSTLGTFDTHDEAFNAVVEALARRAAVRKAVA